MADVNGRVFPSPLPDVVVDNNNHKHEYNESILWLNYVHQSEKCLAKIASTISADTCELNWKMVFILFEIISAAVHLLFDPIDAVTLISRALRTEDTPKGNEREM